jgi:hypothetical protein
MVCRDGQEELARPFNGYSWVDIMRKRGLLNAEMIKQVMNACSESGQGPGLHAKAIYEAARMPSAEN